MGDVPRHDMATIATLIGHVPDVQLLPTLRRMLDHNLERYVAVRAAAAAANWQPGPNTNQARSPETYQYLRAFLAIDAQETRAVMREYLTDPYFGELAAQVIVGQWVAMNEPRSANSSLSPTAAIGLPSEGDEARHTRTSRRDGWNRASTR